MKLVRFAAQQAGYLQDRLGLSSQRELALTNMVQLAEETGDVASTLLAFHGLQRGARPSRGDGDRRADLGCEIGDVIATVAVLAHAVGLDIDHWARELGVTAHWLRHTTLTDIERLAGVRIAGAYAGHADGGFGVTGRYRKPTLEELRLAHGRLFFDDAADPGDPCVSAQLFRRVVPMAPVQIEFAAA